MKKILSIALITLSSFVAFAQKYIPQIKVGTILKYNAFSRAFGQSIPLTLTITNLTSAVDMQYSIPQLGTGTFEISQPAMQSAKKMAFKEPQADGVTKLKDDETLAVLSKNTFKDLTTSKTFILNGQTFNVTADTAPFKINDQEADVFYAVTTNGKTKMWVLNNPDFPLICKLQGGPQGIDLTLESIK